VDRRSLRRWNRVYREAGGDGLRAEPASGRPSKLEARSKKRLEHIVIDGGSTDGSVEITTLRVPAGCRVARGPFARVARQPDALLSKCWSKFTKAPRVDLR
jgi:hypothetical protein